MMSDFKSFGKIQNISKLYMSITQKLHGSNAQVYIYRDENDHLQLKTGSRSRWITPDDDNYGFAKFVYANKDEFISKLGEGRHFGEYAGLGINSGEGLKEKHWFLFNWRRWKDIPLPPRVSCVPVLYTGKMSLETIDETMDRLKENGSFLVPGYMKPEGIVIEVGGEFYKKVFDKEDVAWSGIKKIRTPRNEIDISHLLQPIRLKKILSKDSQYLENYPVTLKSICADYVKDLEEEGQLIGNEDEIKEVKKALGGKVFHFIKSVIAEEYSL